MTRTFKILFFGVFIVAPLGLATGPLHADATGWHVEIKHGRSSLDHTFGSGVFDTRLFNDESNASSAEVGYTLNRYLGLQAGYHDLGTFQGLRLGSPCPPEAEFCPAFLTSYALEADVSGWSLAAVPAWPLGNRFAVYGKLGAVDWETELAHTEGPPIDGLQLRDLSDTDLLTAVGARYRFASGFGVLLEHQRLDFDLDSTTLGVSWKF